MAALDSPVVGDGFALPSLIINEIGLGLAPVVSVSSQLDQEEVTDGPVNVIEFLNPADVPTETEALTVEFVNPARALIRLLIPDGITVPAGGSFAICQESSLDADPTVFTQVLDAQGFVLNSAVIADTVPWALGSDATEGLAVNLVYRAGACEETGIDTFVANLKKPDLAALSSPLDFGIASSSRRVTSGNFETYFAGLSTMPNIFSRILCEDDLGKAAAADLGSGDEAPNAEKRRARPLAVPTQERAGSIGALGAEGPEAAIGAGELDKTEGDSRQRHRGRGGRRLGGKAPSLQKPGSGGFRSGV